MVDQKENLFIQFVLGVIWLLWNGLIFVDESKKVECCDMEEIGLMDRFVDVVFVRIVLGYDKYGRVMIV